LRPDEPEGLQALRLGRPELEAAPSPPARAGRLPV